MKKARFNLFFFFILAKQPSSPSMLGNAVFQKPLPDQDGLGRGNKQKAEQWASSDLVREKS